MLNNVLIVGPNNTANIPDNIMEILKGLIEVHNNKSTGKYALAAGNVHFQNFGSNGKLRQVVSKDPFRSHEKWSSLTREVEPVKISSPLAFQVIYQFDFGILFVERRKYDKLCLRLQTDGVEAFIRQNPNLQQQINKLILAYVSNPNAAAGKYIWTVFNSNEFYSKTV